MTKKFVTVKAVVWECEDVEGEVLLEPVVELANAKDAEIVTNLLNWLQVKKVAKEIVNGKRVMPKPVSTILEKEKK